MAAKNKTPVSILQEVVAKRGTLPKYELVQIEGAIHEPTFRYRVTVGDYVATGTGRSKKEAKHAAARNVLYKLVGNALGDEPRNRQPQLHLPLPPPQPQQPPPPQQQQPPPQQPQPHPPQPHPLPQPARLPSPRFLDRHPVNPIGTLQEMCMARHWPPPCYELTEEEGLPHDRRFTFQCKMLHFREYGIGRSKKYAKRKAAFKMLRRMQNFSGDFLPPGPEVRRARSGAHFTELNLGRVSVVASPKSPRVSMFHTRLRRCTGRKLALLHTGILKQPDFDSVRFLKDLAFEQQFEVIFVEIDELSASGLYQCLIQLASYPVAVLYGCGLDMVQACLDAADSALEYLRVMTEKPKVKSRA